MRDPIITTPVSIVTHLEYTLKVGLNCRQTTLWMKLWSDVEESLANSSLGESLSSFPSTGNILPEGRPVYCFNHPHIGNYPLRRRLVVQLFIDS